MYFFSFLCNALGYVKLNLPKLDHDIAGSATLPPVTSLNLNNHVIQVVVEFEVAYNTTRCNTTIAPNIALHLGIQS